MAVMKLEDTELPMEIDDGEVPDNKSLMEVDDGEDIDIESPVEVDDDGIRSLIEIKAVYYHGVSAKGATFNYEVRCESPGSSLMVTMHVICSRSHWFNHRPQVPVSPSTFVCAEASLHIEAHSGKAAQGFKVDGMHSSLPCRALWILLS